MNENIILLLSILIAFSMQTFFYSRHIKVINNKICDLKMRGDVLVGKKTHFLKGGSITMFLLDEDKIIKEGYLLKGRTSLSKIKRYSEFDGINIEKINEGMLINIDNLTKESILNGLSYYKKYQINENNI